MTTGLVPFTGGSIPDLKTLCATPTPRADFGVFMDADDDEYGTKISVQIAVPDGDGWNWVDVTYYVRDVDWDRGGTDPLTQPQAGTATITVDNNKGYFSPWNTSNGGDFQGTTYSKIVPNTMMRIGCTRWDPLDHSTIVWDPLFTGRVEKIEEELLDNTDAYVTFTIVDILASLAAHNQGVLLGGGPGSKNAWTAGVAPTLPVTITAGVNDQFKLGTTEFTMAAGTYSDVFTLASVMAAATHSGTPFSSFIFCEGEGNGGNGYAIQLTVYTVVGPYATQLHSGTNDGLLDLGFFDGQGFNTFEDIYYGETGSAMLPDLLTDIGFGFNFVDGVVGIDPFDPFWTATPLQSPERSANRLVAAQRIAEACNCFVYASSAGEIIAVRFGPSVPGAPNFGTFSNKPTGAQLPIVKATSYASTDRILNYVSGQRANPVGPTYWTVKH